jgi:hypothetical protein
MTILRIQQRVDEANIAPLGCQQRQEFAHYGPACAVFKAVHAGAFLPGDRARAGREAPRAGAPDALGL